MSDKLSVFWDGYDLDKAQSGVFRHAAQLSTELVKLGIQPTIYGSNAAKRLLPHCSVRTLENLSFPGARFGQLKFIWPERVHAALKRDVQRHGIHEPAVLHGLCNINLPAFSHISSQLRLVLTIHDLIPLLAPSAVSWAYARQFAFLLPRLLRRAHAVICVSEWTRQSLLGFFPEAKEKITVVANGFSPWQMSMKSTRSWEKPRLLGIFRHEKYKRLELFLEIVRALSPRCISVLVTDSSGVKLATQTASDLLAEGFLIVKTQLDAQAMEDEYVAADVLVHPSLYEGFCLPACEALAHGIPVVYVKGSGIDEVVNETVGVGLDAKHQVADWSEAIKGALQKREDWQFEKIICDYVHTKPTWATAAQATKLVYNQVTAN